MDKENSTAHKQPLSSTNNNSQYQTPKVSSKCTKSDNLLTLVEDELSNNKRCDLMNVILEDPLLKELNTSLQKQAEQQKKNRLMESFPLRYKNLVHTQMLYKKVQIQMKEHQKESQEVIQMMERQKEALEESLDYFKKEIDKKDDVVIKLKQETARQIQLNDKENEEKIKYKDKEIQQRDEKITDCERKILKIKSEKQNIFQFLEQTKEEIQVMKKENQRIVEQLTKKQAEISQLGIIIEEKEKKYQNCKQNFQEKLVAAELAYTNNIKQISRQYNDLSIANDGLRTRLRQCENQIAEVLKEKDDNENQAFEQLQELRSQLLENVKEKNMLEEQIDTMRHENNMEIDCLRKKISILEEQVEKQKNDRSEKQKIYEREILNMKQNKIQIQLELGQNKKKIEDKLAQTELKLSQSHQIIANLQTQKKDLCSVVDSLKSEIQQSQNRYKIQAQQLKKGDRKSKQIEALAIQLRKQFQKINEIVQEKQTKIQQSRQEIISLRQKIKILSLENDSSNSQLIKNIEKNQLIEEAKEKLFKDLQKSRAKEIVLKAQLDTYYQIINREKIDVGTEVELIEGLSQFELQNLSKLSKQMEKVQAKYQNVREELQTYKKYGNADLEQSQALIQQLSKQNQRMRKEIQNTFFESGQIEHVLDAKLSELKQFYQNKLKEQQRKYRKTISMLKSEMDELYKEIDLKKGLQQEIYQDLLKFKDSNSLILQ